MSLGDLLEDATNRRKRFVVYRRGDRTDAEALLASRGVSVEHRELPAAWPGPFLAIEDDGRFVGAIALSEVEGLFTPPVVRPGGGVSEGYRVLFDALDDTVFGALDRRALLAVSREIEDRARRIGSGRLRVGFQRLSAFEPQIERYARLAATTDLDVHVYGTPDWAPPPIDDVTYHGAFRRAIDRHWVLAFVGEDERSGLLARERADGYRGFWTDDAETVASLDAALVDLAP